MGAESASYLAFLESRRSDLRRIAAKSCGEYTLEDVCGEVWLIASAIERKRGVAVDFLNGDDQELLLSWLYSELINFADKNVRFAVRLDKDWDSEDTESAVGRLANLLAAPEHFDPLVWLEARQEAFDPLEWIKESYSQAAAYLILLHRFGWDVERLAEHLRLVLATLRSRIIASGAHMRLQASLFDRVETIDYDFQPSLGRKLARGPERDSGQMQLGWEFPLPGEG